MHDKPTVRCGLGAKQGLSDCVIVAGCDLLSHGTGSAKPEGNRNKA